MFRYRLTMSRQVVTHEVRSIKSLGVIKLLSLRRKKLFFSLLWDITGIVRNAYKEDFQARRLISHIQHIGISDPPLLLLYQA